MAANEPGRLLALPEAAQLTGMSTIFWRREIRARRIRHYRLGRAIRLAEADLATFLVARAVAAGGRGPSQRDAGSYPPGVPVIGASR